MAGDLSFSRSLQVAQADRSGAGGWLLLAGALLAWGTWMVAARITVFEISDHSRLEVAAAGHSADAPVAGRLLRLAVQLEQKVEAGELLAELDSAEQLLHLSEQQTRLRSLGPQLLATQRELVALEQAQSAESKEALAATAVAQAESDVARVRATVAASEAARALRLKGYISEIDLDRSNATASERKEAARASRLATWRLQRTRLTQLSRTQVRLEDLRRTLAALEADQAVAEATIRNLEHELALRSIRAPVTGQVGEVTRLRPGAFLPAGERVALIVPSGDVHIVASMAKTALGRVWAGQQARLRLDGFSWLEYGSASGTVVRVAEELRDGGVRAEIALSRDTSSRIPYQHGLTGTVEIAIEEISPLMLLLRTTGRVLAQPQDRLGSGEGRGSVSSP